MVYLMSHCVQHEILRVYLAVYFIQMLLLYSNVVMKYFMEFQIKYNYAKENE